VLLFGQSQAPRQVLGAEDEDNSLDGVAFLESCECAGQQGSLAERSEELV
jgi:hypothetical protein